MDPHSGQDWRRLRVWGSTSLGFHTETLAVGDLQQRRLLRPQLDLLEVVV